MRILYFAAVRERLGRADETIELPASVQTVGELVAFLRERGPDYDAALGSGSVLAAVDRARAKPEAPLSGAREVAFFPPMTGG
jgi:sulfur-carrier protein